MVVKIKYNACETLEWWLELFAKYPGSSPARHVHFPCDHFWPVSLLWVEVLSVPFKLEHLVAGVRPLCLFSFCHGDGCCARSSCFITPGLSDGDRPEAPTIYQWECRKNKKSSDDLVCYISTDLDQSLRFIKGLCTKLQKGIGWNVE